MRRIVVSLSLLLGFGGAALSEGTQSFERIERGRYIAVLGDCAGCHTAPGGQPFAGGLSLETPFGRLLAPNITPDRDTGIGSWSKQEFIAAVRDGRGHNGTRLYPAMPYPTYTRMSDDDVEALRVYFTTIDPVRNEVVSNQLPFPFNIRLSLAFWNWMNFEPGPFRPDASKSEQWNRGAYIVQGPGHCGTCHTPKNILGGDKTDRPLSGTVLQGWFAPNITGDDRNGIGRWNKDDLVRYLRSGANNWTLASGPMAEAVSHSTSQMSDADLAAIATYLKDNGGSNGTPQPAAAISREVMKVGAAIYKDSCAACHRDNGQGDSGLFPRLASSALVQSDVPTTLIRVVLQGSRSVSTQTAPTAPAMPAFHWRFDDAQVAAVINYIRNSWGNAAPEVDQDAIRKARAALASPSSR
jgi:mono/diheme cytochrome c family protein